MEGNEKQRRFIAERDPFSIRVHSMPNLDTEKSCDLSHVTICTLHYYRQRLPVHSQNVSHTSQSCSLLFPVISMVSCSTHDLVSILDQIIPYLLIVDHLFNSEEKGYGKDEVDLRVVDLGIPTHPILSLRPLTSSQPKERIIIQVSFALILKVRSASTLPSNFCI